MAGGIDPFCQSPGTYLAQGLHGVGYFIWKVFSVPYHILLHDKTLRGAIYALSRPPYGSGGVQDITILESKFGYYDGLVKR